MADRIPALLFVKKQPKIISISPTKLLVPGKPILAIENKIKKTENNGVVVNKPA